MPTMIPIWSHLPRLGPYTCDFPIQYLPEYFLNTVNVSASTTSSGSLCQIIIALYEQPTSWIFFEFEVLAQ